MTTQNVMEKRPEETSVTRAERTWNRPSYTPAVDIIELEEKLLVQADMPGLRPEDVDIQFEQGTLVIHGKVAPRQDEGVRYLMREYGVGDFHRTFQVSEIIDSERISAEYANGVLTLHLPKQEKAKPRKIAVKG